MSRIDSQGSIGQQVSALGGSGGNGTSEGLRDLNLDEFLGLMIAELQNQDPLNPMENSDILQQVSQIREISSTDKLSETLDAVLTGQNLTTASSMIGKAVHALTDDSTNIRGVVDRVSIEVDKDNNNKRTLKVHIGDKSVALSNVREIFPSDSEEAALGNLLDEIDAAAAAINNEEEKANESTEAETVSPPDVQNVSSSEQFIT